MAISCVVIQAQERPGFDPERFEVELEQFIATDAALTPQEASVFFPLYKEMQTKQRFLFNKMRPIAHFAGWNCCRIPINTGALSTSNVSGHQSTFQFAQ